jgi:hypothetical protein
MTARDLAREAHERFFAAVLEADLDFCQNTYGVDPCTAGRVATGTAQSGTSNTIRLAAGTAIDPTNMAVRLTGGTGIGQERKVIAWNAGTKDATVSPAWTVIPDATSTYNVIDRPNACYNTFFTCQDEPNYVKGVKTYGFCTRGMPIPSGETYRPYIDNHEFSPTEIDVNHGLARSSRTQLTLVDEPDSDIQQDPYFEWRTARVDGTFWPALIARNPNYSGRFARLRKGYPVTPWDWATFVSELYILDTIKDNGGTVTVVLKDILKLADRTMTPAPTDGKLAADITAAALSLTLDAGKGALYGASGYVAIADEVINFTGRAGDVLSWPATSNRAQFGTVAAAHNTNDKVQLCKVFINALLTDVLIALWNDAGVTNTYLDTAQMAAEDALWLSDKYRITACLADPQPTDERIVKLLRDANAVQWWDPVAQKMKFLVDMPGINSNVPVLDETGGYMKGSLSVERLDEERLTEATINYAPVSPTANLGETKNYKRGLTFKDVDASGPNEFNDTRADVYNTPFLTEANDLAATALVTRKVRRRRNVPEKFRFHVDPKDYEHDIGALVDLDTSRKVKTDRKNAITRARITRLTDRGRHVEYEARATTFAKRYAFIAPNGQPDYAAASDPQRQYAFIAAASGKMSNGDDGYVII